MNASVTRRSFTAGAMVAAIAAVLSSAGELRAQGINVTQYSVTSPPSQPVGITSGPDGALWFTDNYAGNPSGNTGSIGRITTTGTLTRYPITVGSQFFPQQITAGSDGALWFGQAGGVTSVTTAGTFTQQASPGVTPIDITSGPDGALWFTDSQGANIWRVTTAGVLTQYAMPNGHAGADSITSGPDGALWFTADGHTTIGRITTAGVFGTFTPIPGTSADGSFYPKTIVAGSDGALWFTVPFSDMVGRITTGMVVTTYNIPSASEATAITSGSDGALWAIEPSNNHLARVTTAGAVTEYALPSPGAGFISTLNGITSGPDGDLWYTEYESLITAEGLPPAGIIGQVAIIPQLTVTAACPANTAISGQPYSFTVSTTGGLAPLTWSLQTGPLPAGLTLNSSTGVISGTTTALGTYPILVVVTDSSSPTAQTATYNCSIIVTTQLTVSATCPAAGAVQNAAYSFPITASGGQGPLTWSLTTGSFPTGVTLNPATGVISGTPTVTGTFPFSVTVSDTSTPPQMVVYSCSIVVSGKLTVTATCPANTAVLNTPYSFSITTSGGLAPLTWTLATGALPPGLTLNTGTGVISGTPNTVGTYPYSVTVTDSTSPTKQTATFNCSITVATQLTITSGCPAPSGFPSTSYTYTLTASGGTLFNPAASGYTYQWSILPAASSLPPGLALANTGNPNYLEQIQGTPTTAGNYAFTLQAQDAGGQVATKACSIAIIGPLTITAPTTLSNGTQNSTYPSTTFQAQGGVMPYTWSASGLPSGLTLSTAGVLTGTPTQLGTFNPTITVIDSSFFSVNITDYPVTTTGAAPYDIVQGPDGALWFTETNANKIGRISTAGVVTNEYTIPTPGSQPAGIVVGPDGALWFTETVGNKIGRITTAGVITNEFPVLTAGAEPYGITTGPDGALWFTETLGNKIGRMTAAGVVTNETVIPTAGSTPEGIAVGPDGALWFTEISANQIGRITTANVITNEFTVPTPASNPSGIVAGPDGALWFTEGNAGKIGRITTAGVVTNEYPIPTATSGSLPFGITVGPDGAVWFSEGNGNNLGRITTAGVLTQYTIPTPASGPSGITAGPDGAVWFTEFNGNKIGRVGLGGEMAQRTYSLTINLPLLSISAACPAPMGTVGGQYILFPITVTGGNGVYTLAYSGPSWLSLVYASGAAVGGSFITSLTGIPPAEGTYPISVQATDTAGSTPAVYDCNVIVNPPPLGITSSCPASFTIGVPVSQPLSAVGGSGSYSWSIAAGSLPAGVQLVGALISGTPGGSPGVANFTIQVSSGGTTAQEPCSVTIILAPLKFAGVCPGNGTVNVPYGPLTLTATGGLGQSSYTFSVQGSLPTGVSLTGNTVGGTPTQTGTFNFTFQVSSGTQTANGSPCSVTIAPAALGVTGSCSAASINVGANFSMSVSVTGGKSPYSFAISGAPWVTLNPPSASGDTASGTPIAANGGNSYTVTITASDSANSTPASFSCTVAVNSLPKLTIGFSCPASSIPPGTAVNIPAGATGGLAPYSWGIGGNSGLSLSSSTGSSTSVVGNAPAAAGNYSFSVSVGDSASSPPASQGCSFTVPFSLLQIQGSCPASSLNLPISLSIPLTASGGQPPYSWSLSAPSFLGLSGTTGSSVTLSSTGTPSASGPFSFTVSLSDGSNNTAAPLVCNSTINPPAVPPLSITGLTPTTNSLQTVNVGVQLGSPAPLPLTGILQITFTPNAFDSTGNPQVMFSGGGTQFTFTIPAGQTTIPIPNIQQGTVAGTIVVTLIDFKQGGTEVLPSPPPSQNLVIQQQVPVVTSVCFSNQTSNSFDVVIAGYSNPRNMTSVTLAFQAASGASISGGASFTENVSSLFSQFYSSAQSQLAGSLFSGLDIPVTISGNVSAIGSVTVTLTNSVGNSQPFTQSLTSANACTAGSL